MPGRMELFDRLLASSIGWVPRSVVGRVARRYVAGETLDEGLEVARRLGREGCCATFDLLGEFISRIEEGERSTVSYLRILDSIAGGELDANVSVKLTSFGLHIDEEAAFGRVRRVVARARDYGNFVRLDMEDSPRHDATFRIYRRLRQAGLDNVGLVLQAYMRRAVVDVAALSGLVPNYRLCKGIYVEPAEIAYKDFDEVRGNYLRLLSAMLDGGSFVGIATHDPHLVAEGEKEVARRGLGREQVEFQMLLGVADDLRRQLVNSGHRLRVYVPFGRDWYAYCVRRLKENPAIGRYVLKALFQPS